MILKYLTRRRAIIVSAVAIAMLGAFAFFKVRRPAAQEIAVVAVDSAAIRDSLARVDSIAQAKMAKDTVGSDTSTVYRAGEDPNFAAKMGWPVKGPTPLPGAILPNKRIVAYYGNPLSKKMGILGELPPPQMLAKFDRQLEEWRKADPSTPVQPALHLIAVVAQADPGKAGKYRMIMPDSMVEDMYRLAQKHGSILFIDIQVGQSDIREILPKFDKFLARPDVHLAIDPEFMMKHSREGVKPGAKIGQMDAADVNYASAHLAEIVRKNNLPAKVLIIHRFTRYMLTNSKQIQLRPEVQMVINMDGWGAPWLKRDSYKAYVVREPVQYTGFKLFYHNDTKKGDALLSPTQVLKLRPQPLYIQYQ